MEHQEGFAVGRADRWQPAVVPLVATGLVLLERALMDELGSPVMLLRGLGDLGRPWTDPVASVLAVMALTGELLVGYVTVVLVLGSLGKLPGSTGRLAARLASLVTPAVVRQLLDLLVGGALLAQATLATPPGAPPGHRWSGVYLSPTASSLFSGPVTVRDSAPTSPGAGTLGWPVDSTEPVGARPAPRWSAAPLPPWLGGGPSKAGPSQAARTYTVEAGDTLWDIAAAHLDAEERSAAAIHRYWQRIYGANRPAVGADPDLIHPGGRLVVPPHDQRRR